MKEAKFLELKEQIEQFPLAIFDHFIGELAKMENISKEDQHFNLDLMARCICRHLNIDFKKYGREGVFKEEANKFFVGICLLRILTANDRIISYDTHFERKTYNLFNQIFRGRIYNASGVELKDQNHIKRDKLVNFVKNKERELQDELSPIQSLDLFETYSNNFRRVLFTKINLDLVKPFLNPTIFNKATIAGVLDLIKKYLEAEEEEKISAYDSVQKILDNIVDNSATLQAGKYFTLYTREYIGKPFERIQDLIDKDFQDSPLGKPAEIVVDLLPKKYPLNYPGNGMNIGISLKNEGPGIAYDLEAEVSSKQTSIAFSHGKKEIRTFKKGIQVLTFSAVVRERCEKAKFSLTVTWNNYEGSSKVIETEFNLPGQDIDIDWKSLKYSEPYNLEYIDNENDLVGRKEILIRLFNSVQGRIVSSSYVYGQKRVGKTSIAKVLQSKIKKSSPSNFVSVYLETGEFQTINDVENTIKKLGTTICRKIKGEYPISKNIPIPNFENSFSDINEFLDELNLIAPECKVLIILDEFDEINSSLYKRSEIGDAFFLSIRAVSNKPNFGFILVGGEKMDLIVSSQGEQINKFNPIRVDYFDKEQQYGDFQELIQKPAPYLEFDPGAIECLHDYTAGNPFFAKKICKTLFEKVIARRDNHITLYEIKEAITDAVAIEGANSFMHFWEDGILEKGEMEEEISIKRRKVLLSIASVLNKSGYAKKEQVLDESLKFGISSSTAENHLKSFVERQILAFDGESYAFKVKYFEDWLVKYGINKIITTFTDREQTELRKTQEEEAKIRPEEIGELTKTWGTYLGKEITTDLIRRWLEQFGSNVQQRWIFKILTGLRFFNQNLVNEKMSEIFGKIRRQMLKQKTQAEEGVAGRKLEEGITGRKLEQSIRSSIFISYIDAPGKSGVEYARNFAKENDIYIKNIIPKEKLHETLSRINGNKTLLFIDDFLGTGDTFVEGLDEVKKGQPEIFNDESILIFIGAIAGFENAKVKIEKSLEKSTSEYQVYIAEPLSDSDRCFHDSSRFFKNVNEKMEAKALCYEKGCDLEKNHPYGYGNCQAAVVFPNTCPNNSLPILWKESKDWTPLFIRQ